ncbi:MAG: PAS domain S-box protein [Nitrospiraceae bacterium]|nr:MAG: PAS domain S-box protein [Nitrospiraceae bacterium]
MFRVVDMNKLRETELRYRTIFEQAPYGILLIDCAGNITDFNETAHRELGYTREEFAGLRISDIDPFQSPQEVEASIMEVLKKGSAEFEVRHRTKHGEIRDVHVITRVLNLSGKNVFQTIWHDITEQKRSEEELNRYREHLEELVRERTSELSRLNDKLNKDIAARKLAEKVQGNLIRELKEALRKIKTLTGLIPICAWCKKIRDDQGYWKKVETYIREHSDASFTHGICPDCLKKESPEAYAEVFNTEI